MANAETQAPTELKTLFNAEVIEDLAKRLTLADAGFDAAGFRQAAMQGLDSLELKARSAHLCEAMAPRLPKDFEKAVALLIEDLGEADGTGGVEGFEAFRFLPFLDYVAAYGLDSPRASLDAMEQMTLHFSAEFTIRPFILRYPDQTMKRMNARPAQVQATLDPHLLPRPAQPQNHHQWAFQRDAGFQLDWRVTGERPAHPVFSTRSER